MSSLRESGTLGTYQRYKLGQAQFQKWLKQTSDKLRPASAKLPTEPILENQAGKGSRCKGNPKTASEVHWSQLESMAETVIDHSEPEQIPRSAITILRDVVHLRKKSAQFFTEAATRSAESEKLKQNNSAHEHIIQVLERILHRFNTFLSKDRPSSHAPTSDEDGQFGMNDINNMFEHLHVEQSPGDGEDREEISDAEVTTTKRPKKFQKKGGKKQKQKKQTKDSRSQKRKPAAQDGSWVDAFKWVDEEENSDDDYENDVDDYYMIIYCFFQDFNTLRTYVTDRWTEYFYHKSVPLDTLAVVTNAACEMFHEMEFELVKALKDASVLSEYEFMLETLFFEYGLDHVDYSKESQLTNNEKNYKILGEADWLGFFAYCNITQILKLVPPGKVPMIPTSAQKPPKYGLHDFDNFRDFTRDVIFDFFPEICLIKAMKTNNELPMIVSAQDELTLDFEDIFRVREYSSATVFNLSLYIDIRYILEDQVEDAFNSMQATAEKTKSILEEQLPNVKNPWDLKKECRFRIKEVEHLLIRDFLEDDKRRRLEEKGVTEEVEKHLLLKKDPIWSGLLDFRCRLILHDIGHRFINESAVVLAAAFVYEAARIDGTRSPRWAQMDRLFDIYGKDKVLRGPSSLELAPTGLLKRFLDYNLAITNHHFPNPSKSLEAFHKRYGSESGYSHQRGAYLGEIIRDVSRAKAAAVKTALSPGVDDDQHEFLDGVWHINPDAAYTGKIEKISVEPVRLLEILDETTTSLLENQLSIDFFQLHTESVLLLEKLLGEFSSEAETDAPFLLVENMRVDKLPLLLPTMYRSMADGNAVEIGKRLGKVVEELCGTL